MQDTLLRVFVVAVGLLICPRDDPGVQEWIDVTPAGLQRPEESLLRGDKLDHEMASVNEEMTHSDSRGHLDDIHNILKEENQSEQHVTEDLPSVLEDVTALNTKQGEDIHTDGSFRDLSQPQEKQEHPEEEVFSSSEQESPLSHLPTETSEKETSDALADWERDYLWFIWNTFSIISMIHVFRKYVGKFCCTKPDESSVYPVTCRAVEELVLDSDTLHRFYSKYVQVSSDKKWKEEFLEGFANDLLEAMRTECDKNGGMVIEDFQMVDMCNIIVPLSLPEPCSFQCLLWNDQASDLLPDVQVCGQIKLVETQSSCPCQSPDADEDMVCLLHCDTEKVKMETTDVCDGPLCMKNSPFLSQSQVTRWFQSTIKQAWGQISHMYEFELNIRYLDAPGALVVRFRSGKKISFSMNPVVKFNSDAHFVISPCSTADVDTVWTLSLTKYEDRFLENISKRLPENSCHIQTLEIANFIHRRQSALSGSSALEDFHFKTALMHLLLTTKPLQWKPNYVADRLRDLLAFMERSLKRKLLHHVLIGNPSSRRIIELPAEFNQARTVNLFHPLVVHDCIYRNAVMHFQEMLKNTHMLIHDYVDQCTDKFSV